MLFKDIKRQAKHYNNSKYVYDTLLTSFSYFIFRIVRLYPPRTPSSKHFLKGKTEPAFRHQHSPLLAFHTPELHQYHATDTLMYALLCRQVSLTLCLYKTGNDRELYVCFAAAHSSMFHSFHLPMYSFQDFTSETLFSSFPLYM
jgi:hypothetical protein